MQKIFILKALRNFAKNTLARRMNIHPAEMDILVQQRAFVTQKTDICKLRSLIRKLSPVIGEGQKMIRLGPKSDGGYLVPDDLTGIKACFSPGVALISGFEKDCADLGMEVFLADKSVDRPSEAHKLFNFTKKYIGAVINDDFMTLDYWVNSSLSENQSDLLLQIDIEGAEYEVFLCMTSDIMNRFRIIVAEFHYLEQLWSSSFFMFASRVFEKILQTHICVHIHPNNFNGSMQRDGLDIPQTLEFTFIRSDRIGTFSSANIFPHPLDFDNTTEYSPLVLPKCWYDQTYF